MSVEALDERESVGIECGSPARRFRRRLGEMAVVVSCSYGYRCLATRFLPEQRSVANSIDSLGRFVKSFWRAKIA
jgi:hypothetical protein